MQTIWTSGRSAWGAVIAAMAMGACAPADKGSVVVDTPDAHEQAPPDAPKAPPARCETGDPPCGPNTECVNFGSFGGQVCAQYCAQSSDCGGDMVCIPDANNRGICATAEWGPPDGILPELLCKNENLCGRYFDDDETGCRAYVNTCLNGKSSSVRADWGSWVTYCANTYTDCDAFFSCMQREVTSCW